MEQAPTAWAELEAVCDLHSVEDRSARTQEILWDRFYLPKLAREHVGRYLEFINPRMYEASSSSCVEQQAASGLNMLLPTTAQISNLHDDRFPHDIGSDTGFYSNVFGSFGVSKIRHPFWGDFLSSSIVYQCEFFAKKTAQQSALLHVPVVSGPSIRWCRSLVS